jgi:hypothetical protein
VTWSSAGEDDGFPVPSHPELEVTDGWYRLRARVDQPIARAIRKGHIKVGRKIAVAGAKVIGLIHILTLVDTFHIALCGAQRWTGSPRGI